MYISKIKIQNFRSIKKLEFEPNKLCTLVGANSSGKTNILKAIDLVLGEGWTTKARVVKELFFDTNLPIEIELFFQETITLNYKNARGDQIANIDSIKLILNLKPELSAHTTINGGETFYGQDEFKKKYHFIYLPANRTLNSEMRVSEWTMLGKLMKKIHENYANHSGSEEKLKSQFKDKMKEVKEFLEHDFNHTVTFSKFNKTLIKYCDQNSFGLANKFQPNLNIYNINQFYKTLQIQIQEEDFCDKVFDAENLGAGMQNLIMLSIFQTYAELNQGNVIFGIEEPEIYLYPNAQRGLYESFIKLSVNSQLFYTTHSQNFVNAQRAYEVEVVTKTKEKGTFTTQKGSYLNQSNSEKGKHQIYAHFNTERNELFFAKRILLVEGDSDKILWTILLEEKWNVDLNKNGISIISCNGKGGVIYFAGVCKLLGLSNYFGVWDRDTDEDYKDTNNIILDMISQKCGLELVPDLEKFVGIPSGHNSKKIKNAYEWAKDIELDKIPKEFEIVKNFLIKETNEDQKQKEIIDPKIESSYENIDLINFTNIDVNMPF